MNNHSTSKSKIKKICYSVLIILFITIIISQIQVIIKINKKNEVLSKFDYSEHTAIYEVAAPKIYGGKTKSKHAVLLLHGYSGSPYCLNNLTDELIKNDIPFYAPLLTGFGQKDFHLLSGIKPEDWIRDSLSAYDLLANFFEEISILGHSNGGSLAVIVSSERPVKHLILTAPNINVSPNDKIYKDILNTPVLSSILKFYMPVFEKPKRHNRITNVDTIDTSAALAAFHYSALPINSLTALWDLQDKADITKSEFEDLSVIYGKYDLSVDMNTFLNSLNQSNIKYQSFCLDNSGHNVFDDIDKTEAIKKTLDILISR